MIKFIATDLDSTLLDKQGKLPPDIFPLAEKLSRLGILFAPASGRQYANLKKLFFPIWEKLLFIGENGAIVKRGDKTLYINPIPAPLVKDALNAVRSVEGVFPILCGADNAYIENSEEPFFTKATTAYSNCFLVNNLDDYIRKEPVCKISVYDGAGASEHAVRILSDCVKSLKLTLSGEHWCDISALNAGKGEAIREIQRLFRLTEDECMAFGDHMNDEGMLRACKHSRAVENAVPAVKALAEKIVPSNADGGVPDELKKLLLKIEKDEKGV